MLSMRETLPRTERPEGPDWESFYANYRKPGYIHGFEIGPKLGGGMFGVVFKARKESIGKSYAIKFLRVEDPGVRDQVLRELDTVALFAQVDHPNLVSIEDQGVVDGIPYILMGYAGEETLKDRFEAGPLSEEDALRFFVQVARGVSALHDHSLVHFDLKPANVFLKGDIARVGDYGLSKLITESAMSLSTGRGTPYYMAPEMLRRKGDHRSDIYSLGILLFEALAGEVPFKGDSEWEVLKGHEEKPVLFPDRVPSQYRALLQKALAKQPEDRFDSVADMLHALRAPASLGESIRFDLPPARPASATAAVKSSAAEVRHALEIANSKIAEAQREAERYTRSSADEGAGWWPWLLLGLAVVFWRSEFSPFRNGSVTIRIGWILVGLAIFYFVRARHSTRAQRRARRSRRRAGLATPVLVVVSLAMFGTFASLYWLVASPGPVGTTPVSIVPAPRSTGSARVVVDSPDLRYVLGSKVLELARLRSIATETLSAAKGRLERLATGARARMDGEQAKRIAEKSAIIISELNKRMQEMPDGKRSAASASSVEGSR